MSNNERSKEQGACVNGIKPNKENQARHAAIREDGCIVCRLFLNLFTPCEIHHIDGAQTQEGHKKTIGLCFYHHRADQTLPKTKEYKSRHPDKTGFEREYMPEIYLLDEQDKRLAA